MKTHRQYIREQIRKNPRFARQLAEADQEVAIAVELTRLRERRRMSQATLAKLTGMKQPAIARMESGAYLPAFGTLRKVIGALNGRLELTKTRCRLVPERRRVAAAYR